MHVFSFDSAHMQNNVLCIVLSCDLILRYTRIRSISHKHNCVQRDYFDHELIQKRLFHNLSKYIIEIFLLCEISIHYFRERLFSLIFCFLFVFDVFFKFFIIFLIFDHMTFLIYSRSILFLKNLDIFIKIAAYA